MGSQFSSLLLWSGIVLSLALLKEVRMLRYRLFVSCFIKGMRKHGKFKISMSNPRSRKVLLTSTENGRELMSMRTMRLGVL